MIYITIAFMKCSRNLKLCEHPLLLLHLFSCVFSDELISAIILYEMPIENSIVSCIACHFIPTVFLISQSDMMDLEHYYRPINIIRLICDVNNASFSKQFCFKDCKY